MDKIYSEGFFLDAANKLRNFVGLDKRVVESKVKHVLSNTGQETMAKINAVLGQDISEIEKLEAIEEIMIANADEFNFNDGTMESMNSFEKKVFAAGAAAILALSILIGGGIYYNAEEEKEFKSYEQRGDVKEIGKSTSDQMAMTNKGQPSYTGIAPVGEYIVTPAHKHYYKVYKYGPNMEKTYKKIITQQEYEKLSLQEVK